MIIYLNEQHYKKHDEVKKLLDYELMHNCNLSGVQYNIEVDNFTWVDAEDEIQGSILLGKILNLVGGA